MVFLVTILWERYKREEDSRGVKRCKPSHRQVEVLDEGGVRRRALVVVVVVVVPVLGGRGGLVLMGLGVVTSKSLAGEEGMVVVVLVVAAAAVKAWVGLSTASKSVSATRPSNCFNSPPFSFQPWDLSIRYRYTQMTTGVLVVERRGSYW